MQIRIVFPLLTVSMVMMGCDITREWQEEVQLVSGKTIVVKRTSIRERMGEPGTTGYGRFKEERVRFVDLASEWVGDVQPISIDVRGSEVVVVGWIRGWGDCAKYGYPERPFAYFVSHDQGWRQIDVTKVSFEPSQNLLLNTWAPEQLLESPVSLTMKSRLDADIRRNHRFLAHLGAHAPQIDEPHALKCTRPVKAAKRSNTTPHADARDVPAPADAPGARAGGRGR